MILVRVVALALALVAAGQAGAASKVTIAAIGDAVPNGGGSFAGPGFTGWPAAAGDGWVAFRGQISGGNPAETIIAKRVRPGGGPIQVAITGQQAPGGGKLRGFLGRPAINAHGDVAFFALVTVPGEADDPTQPRRAGLFLYQASKLTAVALARGAAPGGGLFDLAAPLDPSDPNSLDVPQRTPALDDAGDVAFVSAIASQGSALFLSRAGGAPTAVVRVGDPYTDATVSGLGAPALSPSGTLAFHAVLTGSDGGKRHAIVAIDGTGKRTPLVDEPESRITVGDPITINDRGDVAFLGAPAPGSAPGTSVTGVVSCPLCAQGGGWTYVGFPGAAIAGRGSDPPSGYTSSVLPPSADSDVAAPGLTADGHVVFYASVNSGSSAAIARSGTPASPVVVFGGGDPDAAPTSIGGRFAAADSAPAVDASGGVVFLARLSGGTTSDAVIYACSGVGTCAQDPTVVQQTGDAAPTSGTFESAPFGPPAISDGGDVVFHAFVVGGPSGLFRARPGQVAPVVREGDRSADGSAFFDLVGQPSINSAGTVAFAATVTGHGTGVFVADAHGNTTKVALPGDAAPNGFTFGTIAVNPVISESGLVGVRATLKNDTKKQEAVLIADVAHGSALRAVATTSQGFSKFRDPVITDVPTPALVFNGALTSGNLNGIFRADLSGVISPLAVEGQEVQPGIHLSDVTGAPSVDDAGTVDLLGRRAGPAAAGSTFPQDLGFAIVERTAKDLTVLVTQGTSGPLGGTFKSFGAPLAGAKGHLAFYGSFDPQNRAPAGFFLHTDAGVLPYVQVGDASPIGTRFDGVGTRGALNAHDQLAFNATVSRGDKRSGIFLASPTRLAVSLALQLSAGRGRDRIRIRGALVLGSVNDNVDPAHEPTLLSLTDGSGRTVWSTTVSAGTLARQKKRFVADTHAGQKLPGELRVLRLSLSRTTIRFVAQSPPMDLTARGSTPLASPLTLTVQIGDDSGSAVVPCRLGRRGGRCHA